MRCLKVSRKEPVGNAYVANPKGKNGVGLERGTERKRWYLEHRERGITL